MDGILRENHAILQCVLGMTVSHRTDKSGHTHPQQPVTLQYLDQQEADQIAYHHDYLFIYLSFIQLGARRLWPGTITITASTC